MTGNVSIVCDRLPDLKAEAVQRLSSLQPSDPAGFLTEQTMVTVITDRGNVFLQTLNCYAVDGPLHRSEFAI